MRISLILILLGLSSMIAVPAQAKTAGELKLECLAVNIQADVETKLQMETEGECRGYIHGALEAITTYYIALPGADTPGIYSYVLAPKVNTGQAATVFLKFVAAHPEVESTYAPLVIRDAMTEAGLLTESLVPATASKASPSKTPAPDTPTAKSCRQGYTHCS